MNCVHKSGLLLAVSLSTVLLWSASVRSPTLAMFRIKFWLLHLVMFRIGLATVSMWMFTITRIMYQLGE